MIFGVISHGIVILWQWIRNCVAFAQWEIGSRSHTQIESLQQQQRNLVILYMRNHILITSCSRFSPRLPRENSQSRFCVQENDIYEKKRKWLDNLPKVQQHNGSLSPYTFFKDRLALSTLFPKVKFQQMREKFISECTLFWLPFSQGYKFQRSI